MDVKRIKFERTGGFAGMTISRELEMDDLDENQAEQLQELLDDLDFNQLPEPTTPAGSRPDQFTYVITVETDKGKHTVVTGDEPSSEKMQELLKVLNRLARNRKKQ